MPRTGGCLVTTGIQGKVAVVTGGASGIGRATALAFAREGAKVAIVTARSIVKGEEVVREIKGQGGHAVCIPCDVSKEAEVESMVARVLTEFGRLDYAFNNAGVGPDGVTIPFAPLTEVTEADWDAVIDTNLKGVFLCMKHELRHMTERRSGVIVNTSSTAAMFAKPGLGPYCPAKAGINSVSKVAAQETKGLGIRVNVVCPGPTKGTGMSDRLLSSMKKDGSDAPPGGGAPHAPLPGPPAPPGGDMTAAMGTPDDVARVVIWLCSDEASFVNGQVISVDGGLDLA
jgi:NAD(P)-dependent dehydrogenase (short-subunit alcohol dehydrogenase family)